MSESPKCLSCGHAFELDEIAAITAPQRDTDSCTVQCRQCGAFNEMRSEPQAGAGEPPAAIVRRLVDAPQQGESVFGETVEPGVKPPPESTGSSH